MNEMITIQYESEKPTVSGRELHALLEIGSEYAKWFDRMCEYGFSEGKDYSSFLTNRSDGLPGKPKTDHAITIPMAKELCMLQRTAKGKQCREYFISCEEAWNSPDKIMERALQIAHRRAIEAERRIFGLLEEKETLEIALNESIRFFTVAKYNGMFKKGWTSAQCQFMGKQLSAYCRARAIQIRKCETNDERFGTVNSYPISAWDAFMEGCEYA
jgi:phage anti-repressor protein